MKTSRIKCASVAVACLALCPLLAFSQQSRVREYWHAAWDANDRKQFDEAEKLFLLALEEAEKFPSNLEEREMSYAGLGEFYRQRGDYVKAEPFLRKVLVLNETEFGESSPHLISGFAYLAGFYDEWGRTVEAERLYQRALAIGEETLDRAADEALKKYGAFLDRNNRSPEAREIDAKIEDIKVRRVKKGTTPEANAERAVGMLRTIVTSAVTYQTVYGNGYPASLAVLAPPMDGSVNYSCDAAGLIDDLLAAGEQWGYRIAYNGGELVEQRYEGCTVVGVLSFWVSARPLEYGVTGWHSFFVDDSGVIRRTSEDREATEDDPALEDGDPK